MACAAGICGFMYQSCCHHVAAPNRIWSWVQEKEALAYWLGTEGLPHGYAGIDEHASFLDPKVVDDSLKAHLMLPRTESVSHCHIIFLLQTWVSDACSDALREVEQHFVCSAAQDAAWTPLWQQSAHR